MALTLAALTVISMTYIGEPMPPIAGPSLDPAGTVLVTDKKKKERPPVRPSGESTNPDHRGEIEVQSQRSMPRSTMPDVSKKPTTIFVPIPYPNT